MPDVVRRYRTIVADPPWQVMAGPLRADVGELGWDVWGNESANTAEMVS
jgi:hypothetical protein